LPFNEKEITIKLSDIVSVLIVFDDKPPAMGVVVVGDMLSLLTPCPYVKGEVRGEPQVPFAVFLYTYVA
jgi:hypothetical protein